jgi:hypothetical protein
MEGKNREVTCGRLNSPQQKTELWDGGRKCVNSSGGYS